MFDSDWRTPFLQTIIENPSEDSPRLVYADSLEERGECDRAELIRIQCELAGFEEELPVVKAERLTWQPRHEVVDVTTVGGYQQSMAGVRSWIGTAEVTPEKAGRVYVGDTVEVQVASGYGLLNARKWWIAESSCRVDCGQSLVIFLLESNGEIHNRTLPTMPSAKWRELTGRAKELLGPIDRQWRWDAASPVGVGVDSSSLDWRRGFVEAIHSSTFDETAIEIFCNLLRVNPCNAVTFRDGEIEVKVALVKLGEQCWDVRLCRTPSRGTPFDAGWAAGVPRSECIDRIPQLVAEQYELARAERGAAATLTNLPDGDWNYGEPVSSYAVAETLQFPQVNFDRVLPDEGD